MLADFLCFTKSFSALIESDGMTWPMADGSCTDALRIGVGSHTYLKNTKDLNIRKAFVISGGT